MKRLFVLLLVLVATPLKAQNAVSVKNDPSYIWAEASSGITALDALISKLSALDMGIPPAMWATYRSSVQSLSTSEGDMRYMKRTDIPKLFDSRRQKVRELLQYALSERSADVARTYLGWAETYLLSLPKTPQLQREAEDLRKRLGDGPSAYVKMRNVETEVKLIEKASGKKASGESLAPPKAAGTKSANHRANSSSKALGAGDPPVAVPAPRTESLEPVGAFLRTGVDCSAPQSGLAARPDTEPSAAAAVQMKFFIIPGVNIGNTVSYAFMAGVRHGRLGAYAAAYSGFAGKHSEYTCLSDGTTDFGRIWTSGESSRHRWGVTGGLIMGVSESFCLTVGAGYGRSLLYWQDTAGRWAAVEDQSVSGLRAELGAILSLCNLGRSRLVLSTSFGTTCLRTVDASAGLGICF